MLFGLVGVSIWIASILTGVKNMPENKKKESKKPIIFVGTAIVLNMVIEGFFVLLLLFGVAFSTPKGVYLLNYYTLVSFFVLQSGLLWLPVWEAIRTKKSLWLKHSVLLIGTCLLFFLVFYLTTTPYAFFAFVGIGWVIQLFYYRKDVLTKIK